GGMSAGAVGSAHASRVGTARVQEMSLLQLDATLLIQMGIFFVLLFVLNRILFAPVLEAIRLRAEQVDGRRAEAVRLHAEAEALCARYQATLDQARQEAGALRKQLIDEGKSQEQRLVDEARQAARKEFEASEQRQEEAIARAREQIPAQVPALASQIARRVLRSGTAVVVLLLLLLLLGPAHAAAEPPAEVEQIPAAAAAPATESGCWLRSEAAQLGGWTLNFVLLLWLLGRGGAKPIRQALAGRRERVVADLAEAARLKEEAVDLLSMARSRLEGLEEERQSLLQSFREEGERERARLFAEAEQQAARIRRDTVALIEQEALRARQTIQVELIEQALVQAEQQLRQQLTPEEDGRQLEIFLTLLGNHPPAAPGSSRQPVQP
ncbi:MAG: ATP synthase F0 subunit B, partial [Deltaproteobacteria bacterium]|nr:ATP synthase F0 subunit B [Deltaproteobacteria bacterium]